MVISSRNRTSARRGAEPPEQLTQSSSSHPQHQKQQQNLQCAPLVALGAEAADSPADVAARADITFGMLADPPAALAAATEGDACVAAGLRRAAAAAAADNTTTNTKKKMYVDMSTVDAETSAAVGRAVEQAGGLFLEAPVSGSKGPAQQGQLVVMAAGSAEVFAAAEPYFAVMSKRALHLSDAVGAAARMKLVVNGVMGAMMAAFGEGMALAEASDLKHEDLVEILGLGAMACPMFALKAGNVQKREYPPAFPLKHAQKDLRLALLLGDEKNCPTPVIGAANQLFVAARAAGHADSDFAAVYEATAAAATGVSKEGPGGKRARAGSSPQAAGTP
jgi:glyoxylate/succinic semialdehyde reductase